MGVNQIARSSERFPGWLLATVFLWWLVAVPCMAQTEQPHVAVLTVAGPIGPATTDYLRRSMDAASGAQAIVLRMDTPGGLDAATRDIIQTILRSPVPVITYVTPAGARAASAGTYILYGSHVAAMTPSTNLGAATPVQMGSSLRVQADAIDEVQDDPSSAEEVPQSDSEATPTAMERKVVNDSVAFIRGLANRHNRNADWAEAAVREAVSATATEALRLNVIDLVATDLADLLTQVDGREVQMEHDTQVVSVAGLPTVDYEPDWRNELLSIITSPQIAYILLLVGIYGLILEGYNPGALVPGIVGAISLLLALYALQMLPINYVGLGLIVLGAILILAEAFAPSFGVLGMGGVVAMVLGSVMLIDTDVPGMEMPKAMIGGIAFVSSAAVLTVIVAVGRTLQMNKVRADRAMEGRRGEVRLVGGKDTKVMINGELWLATSDQALTPGQTVTVTHQRGLKLEVIPTHSHEREERS